LQLHLYFFLFCVLIVLKYISCNYTSAPPEHENILSRNNTTSVLLINILLSMSSLLLLVGILFKFYLNYLYKNVFLCIIVILFTMEWLSNLSLNSQLPIFIWAFQKLNNPLFNALLLLCVLVYCITLFRIFYKGINLFYFVILVHLLLIYLNNNFFIVSSNLSFFKVSDISIKLLNGLIMIHPMLLYIYYSLLIIYFAKTWFFRVYLYRNTQYLYFLTHNQTYLLGFASLFLGSWWSAQELNWGGFWSWDLVEIFLLISVLFTIISVHSKITNSFFFFKLVFFFFNYIVYILSVRFNLINSIHNFVISSAFFYKYTYIIVLVILSTSYLCKLLLFYRGVPLTHTTNYNRFILNIMYLVLVFYVFATYVYFFIFNQTSISLINAVPNIIIPFLGSYLIKHLNLLSTLLPIHEILIISAILIIYKKYTFITAVHVIVISILYMLLLYFNLVLLIPLNYSKLKFDTVCFNNNYILVFALLDVSNLSDLPQCNVLLNKIQSYIDLNIDFLSPTSVFSTITNSNIVLSPIGNYTLFLYKFFCKLTFIDNVFYIVLLFFFIKVYNALTNYKLFF
jgi:hypothetical protein